MIGVMVEIGYDGKTFRFEESETLGTMEWAAAEAQSMSREMFDAIAADATGVVRPLTLTLTLILTLTLTVQTLLG
jgi:hypothetical protein